MTKYIQMQFVYFIVVAVQRLSEVFFEKRTSFDRLIQGVQGQRSRRQFKKVKRSVMLKSQGLQRRGSNNDPQLGIALKVLESRMANLRTGCGLAFFGLALWIGERFDAPSMSVLPFALGILCIGACFGNLLEAHLKKRPFELTSM